MILTNLDGKRKLCFPVDFFLQAIEEDSGYTSIILIVTYGSGYEIFKVKESAETINRLYLIEKKELNDGSNSNIKRNIHE